MNLQKFTQKSIEAVQAAQSMTIASGNQQMGQEHLLLALTEQQNGLIAELFRKAGASPESISASLRQAIERLPKVSGGIEPDKIYISRDVEQALTEAERQSEKMKDDFVSVEHIMLGILQKPQENIKRILTDAGVTKDSFQKVLKVVRGNQHVTTDNPEGTYDVLNKYGQDLVELARQQKLDPVIGRDDEIRNVIRILSRKTKNNPCLIGEPGVGKTAHSRRIALRIVRGDVPG